MAKIPRESNLRLERPFLLIKKVILASLNTNSGGKHQSAMNHSLVKRRTHDVISLTIEQQFSEILHS